MDIIIFILVLGILVFVHELGHFLFAKLFGIRVEEFGFGYPPLMKKIGQWRGTKITLNWIPFGGFVKIFGEADDGVELSDADKKVSLVHKPRWKQFLVMFGGILFNLVFAWLIFSTLYMTGIRSSVDSAPENYVFENSELIVTSVSLDSPAAAAGLLVGDEIKEYYSDINSITVTDEVISDVSTFIDVSTKQGSDVGMVVLRDGELKIISLMPEEGIIANKYGIGVNIERIGDIQLSFFPSLRQGMKSTASFTKVVIIGFGQLITGSISFDQVSGPVGIAGQVGQASQLGFSYLLLFTALLSINLAVLNLIPFPALDGGRILIIAIESVIRRRLNPKVINWVNMIGFFSLILLMLVVTVNDVINLF